MTGLSKSVRCPSVLLASEDTTAKKWRWVQVAQAGEYHGYLRDGEKESFEITAANFETMIANLHAHPSYVAGENGQPGTADVIPWDFSHASEQPATSGSIPYVGAPAAAWTSDLEIRTGENGVAQLWAYTRWLDPAAEYVKEGRYRWASLSVAWNPLNPVTGEEMGDTITSIALTNQPFIEGMEALAASRNYGSAEPTKVKGDDMALLKDAAEILGVRESDETVLSAVRDGATLRSETKKVFKLDREATTEIVAAATKAVTDADSFAAILAAMGVKTAEEATVKLLALLKDSQDLAAVKPKLDELEAAEKEREAKAIETEVSAAMQAHRMPEASRVALSLLRKTQPEEFKKSFPALPADSRNLTQTVTTAPTAPAAATTIDLGMYPGPNTTARAMSYIKAHIDTAGKLNHDDTFLSAVQLCKRPGVVDSRGAN